MTRFDAIMLVSIAMIIAAQVEGGVESCDPSYPCKYTDGSYSWDLSPLCTAEDLQATDQFNHTYYFRVCGQASAGCYPNWPNNANHGVALQLWGSTLTGTCFDKDGNTHACTRSCEVLGVGSPVEWGPVQDDPQLGVHVSYKGANSSWQDPNWCGVDPKTGDEYPRSVDFIVQCDPSVPVLAIGSVSQSPDNSCAYSIALLSRFGCPMNATFIA
eukprot:CAMPEP_0196780392 /NCGR_PEP_ID=MMETSP1104-20130614/7781_1 /TAXON_ID=33652 /ORGANISM="Cafeteria sp., Strain Caron Lab Isolate" /LENGTH=213 /DNA_ID=CAMNT_0042150591 /DNA_START=51 /DNA_END=692 /DNA_ORIENTATION=+